MNLTDHKYNQGFTLMEVLITIMVLSIGLLGLAHVQVSSLSLLHESLMRSKANQFAKDMADRMRSNINETTGGVASAYHNPNGTSVANPNCLGVDNTGAPVATVCTTAQLASHDFYEWNGMLGGQAATAWHAAIPIGLPGGVGRVCIDSTPNDGAAPPGNIACDNTIAVTGTPVFAIKIWWNENNDINGAVTKRYVMSFQP